MSIKNNISAICKSVGDKVKIVAVTKNRTISEINEAIEAGITNIGESRLQEAKEKIPHLPKNITKHFIGRLQTNKVSEVIRLFDVIQSVDSLKLAQKISEECIKIGKTMPILIQVNTSGEPQKGGVKPEELMELIKKVSELPNIKIEGLMTIAIDSEIEGKVRECFRLLKELFESAKSNFDFRSSKFDFKWLSMGMSGDYKIAIEEGANMVRIGRALLGPF
jgi:pyridoxal phosphate enzyme (YggS family)